MTIAVLVAGAISVGLVVGMKRYGGWKRWRGDIRKQDQPASTETLDLGDTLAADRFRLRATDD